MSSGRAAVTLGALLRLREQLDFIRRGEELLKMKRDNLAAETNRLLTKVGTRHDIEQRLVKGYANLRTAYLTLGYSRVQSQAFTVTPLEAKTRLRSIMGVLVPEIVQGKKPATSSIVDPSVFAAAEQLSASIGELLGLAEAEAKIECIAHELMMTNRKVNALERVLIPNLQQHIQYIEGRLEEETLEEFSRAKRVKAVIRGQTK